MELYNSGYDWRHGTDFKIERPKGSGDYTLLIVRSPAYMIIQGVMHHIQENSVVVLKKNSPITYGADGTEFVNDWIHFDVNENDLAMFERIGIVFDRVMQFQDVYALSRFIKQICIERRSGNQNATESINFLIYLLFLKISDFSATQPTGFTTLVERLRNLRNNIFSNPQAMWSIESISKSLSISPSYLQHKYKQLFGNSIITDITLSRIEYSKYLLANTKYAVSQISQMSGYENVEHFTRIFKRETGQTPTQHRTLIASSQTPDQT